MTIYLIFKQNPLCEHIAKGGLLLRLKMVFIAAKGVAFIAFIILKLVEAFAVNFVRVAHDDEGVFVKRFDRLLDLFYLVVFNAGE